ncbi:MAG: malonyl-CoA O-methyltransferase [Frankiaceae bacterium]|jgi:SAM-dependent methyltransferase|nr:malonyl-CoA O-methyltransferase [Frankiaceae bacterium]
MADGPSLLPVAATLLALAGIRTGETVVDVGCGSGWLTHPAAAAAGADGEVYGVDPSLTALAEGRARRPSGVRWVCAQAARLPLATGIADKVLNGPALHLLPDVRAMFAEQARVLSGWGRVAASAWGAFAAGPEEAAFAEALAAYGADPATYAARLVAGGTPRPGADLPALLREAGLRVVHETTDEVTVRLPDAAAYAAWRLGFAHPTTSAANVVAFVAAALGPEPVAVPAVVHSATASPQI